MRQRFEEMPQGEQFASEYDFDSDEVWDVQNRGVAPVQVVTEAQINLAVAGTLNLPGLGYGFALYVQNAASGAVYQEALVNVSVNAQDNSDPSRVFPCKCGRGYIGAFQNLFLQWPADTSGTYQVRFVIFKSDNYPWIGGEEAT